MSWKKRTIVLTTFVDESIIFKGLTLTKVDKYARLVHLLK